MDKKPKYVTLKSRSELFHNGEFQEFRGDVCVKTTSNRKSYVAIDGEHYEVLYGKTFEVKDSYVNLFIRTMYVIEEDGVRFAYDSKLFKEVETETETETDTYTIVSPKIKPKSHSIDDAVKLMEETVAKLNDMGFSLIVEDNKKWGLCAGIQGETSIHISKVVFGDKGVGYDE